MTCMQPRVCREVFQLQEPRCSWCMCVTVCIPYNDTQREYPCTSRSELKSMQIAELSLQPVANRKIRAPFSDIPAGCIIPKFYLNLVYNFASEISIFIYPSVGVRLFSWSY